MFLSGASCRRSSWDANSLPSAVVFSSSAFVEVWKVQIAWSVRSSASADKHRRGLKINSIKYSKAKNLNFSIKIDYNQTLILPEEDQQGQQRSSFFLSLYFLNSELVVFLDFSKAQRSQDPLQSMIHPISIAAGYFQAPTSSSHTARHL